MSQLEGVLKDAGIKDVYVVGLAFDYCVKYTAIDAAKAGFKTTVLESATRAVDQSDESLEATRNELREAGVYVDVSGTSLRWRAPDRANEGPEAKVYTSYSTV